MQKLDNGTGGHETAHIPRPESVRAADPESEQIRVETYTLLAGLLRSAPDPEILQALAAAAPASSDRPTALERAWQTLADSAASADPVQLQKEFHDLFIGLGRGELLPYGSWYISGFLMEKPLAALRDELTRLGLGRAEGVAETEDHAAAICETMALLADPEHGLCLGDQKAFFAQHAGAWLPRFFKDLQSARRATFYVSVGQLGEAFMEFEKVWLDLPE